MSGGHLAPSCTGKTVSAKEIAGRSRAKYYVISFLFMWRKWVDMKKVQNGEKPQSTPFAKW